MARAPLQHTLELTPKARLDVIDVRSRLAAVDGSLLGFPRCLYYSFHTTAGYLDESLASRVTRRRPGLRRYMGVFRAVFPPQAGYRHDQLDARVELTQAQRKVEPRNADSHLAFIAAGLRTCVSYANQPAHPVCFIDLDGVARDVPRRRLTSVIGYNREIEVARVRLKVPVSGHSVDSVNLREPRMGIYDRVSDLIARHGVTKGRVSLRLAPEECHAGLTVNEYETLLMRYDLADVLRDPLRFIAEKGKHVLSDPGAIPVKTLGYAKYDLVRALNQLFDALGLNESLVERVISRAIALPAARFLRMKRSVSLLVSDVPSAESREPKPAGREPRADNRERRGQARRGAVTIVEGQYQSPILVQWRGAERQVRTLDVILTRFV